MRDAICLNKNNGFSLIEMMIALAILSFGLLAAGPLMYSAARSNSVARSKSTASTAAQSKLETLADLYYQNPLAEDLMFGGHGPQQAQVVNPNDGAVLNRYEISWMISRVPDPRPGKIVDARLVRVTITPIHQEGMESSQSKFNKTLNVSTIFSPKMQ
jgi:prepilin-type N-terminal cleavage/methylation domain-containing protein